MHRRTWLTHALAPALGSILSTTSTRLWAAPAAAPDARFLLVFLRGGYDAASLLVPRERGFYDEQRPNLAIPLAIPLASPPAADGINAPGARPLDADWALHPALEGNVGVLARRGDAVFVPFAGTHDRSRSHFETQDGIELGLPQGLLEGSSAAATAAGAARSGFLNRLAQQLQGRTPIAFGERLPLAWQGPLDVAQVALRNPQRTAGGSGEAAAMQSAVRRLYQGHALQARVESGLALQDEVAREIAAESARGQSAAAPGAMAGSMAMPGPGSGGAMAMDDPARARAEAQAQAASRQAVSPRGFEVEARRIGLLMRERYALGFVDVGGWDTHVNQGAATGTLATRLEELGRGLAALAESLGPAWARTRVVVISEFGRTMRENGNRGTDHGHGSVHWVLGGGLGAGGPVRGEQLRIGPTTLHEGRDWPVLTDYRSLIAGVLARQFGLGPAALAQVFPGLQAGAAGLDWA